MKDSTDNSRTRFYVLTAAGRSAVASIAVVGPAAVEIVGRHFQAANGRLLSDQPVSRIVYGRWEGAAGEDLVVCRRRDDEVEIHCHGGAQSVARIVAALAGTGARQLDWREWIDDRNDSQLEAEAQAALASATTLPTATILLDQYHGALRRELEAVHGLLAAGSSKEAAERVDRLWEWADLGLHLTRPWRVVIGGLPNVGKSTLVNALAGYRRAIEYDQPGTTRDVVSASTALDGWPVELSDTAGLHETGDQIELAGIALAKERLRQANLVLWLLDATTLATGTAPSVAAVGRTQAEAVAAPWVPSRTLVVVNKCDLAVPPAELTGASHLISAAVGTGIPELIAAMVQRLVSQVPPPGAAVPFTERQVGLLAHARDHCHAQRTAAADRAILQLLAPTQRQ